MAKVEIIIGPMFSGKSTELIRRCHRYECINKNVLIINSKLDTRCDDNNVKTHSNQLHKAIKTDKLLSLDSALFENIDTIGIDEAQFFPDLPEFIFRMENRDITIIIAGLDGDFRRKPFGKILECIPLAESVTKLTAMCSISKDGTPGSFTKRIGNYNSIVDIGADDKYHTVCRKHYLATPSSDYHN